MRQHAPAGRLGPTRRLARATIATALVLVAVSALAACNATQSQPNPTGSTRVVTPGGPDGSPATGMPDAAEGAEVSEADVEFVTMMIGHHLQAVELAELARTRIADPDLAGLAERIRLTQAAEAEAMQGWVNAHAAGRPGDHQHDITMPGAISATTFDRAERLHGTAFDLLFIDVMAAHHRGAIEMAEKRLSAVGDAAIARWAREIATSQAIEIDRLEEIEANAR